MLAPGPAQGVRRSPQKFFILFYILEAVQVLFLNETKYKLNTLNAFGSILDNKNLKKHPHPHFSLMIDRSEAL